MDTINKIQNTGSKQEQHLQRQHQRQQLPRSQAGEASEAAAEPRFRPSSRWRRNRVGPDSRCLELGILPPGMRDPFAARSASLTSVVQELIADAGLTSLTSSGGRRDRVRVRPANPTADVPPRGSSDQPEETAGSVRPDRWTQGPHNFLQRRRGVTGNIPNNSDRLPKKCEIRIIDFDLPRRNTIQTNWCPICNIFLVISKIFNYLSFGLGQRARRSPR